MEHAFVPNFEIDSNAVHALVVQQLESWVAGLPVSERTKPFVAAGEPGGAALSPTDILQHVQGGTDLGNQLLQHAVALAVTTALTDN